MKTTLKITLAQINPTVGDMEHNVELMRSAARKAELEGANLVVFPELSLTGYYPGDLLETPQFMQRVEAGQDAMRALSRELAHLNIAYGLPLERSGPGHRLHNALKVLRAGKEVLTYAKQLLPTYGVFDERRHFEPGPDTTAVLNIDGFRVAFLICEDAWNTDLSAYGHDPMKRVHEAQPDALITMNASPSHVGKREQKLAMFSDMAARIKIPLLYVNQVGGQDQLVYDGGSFAINAQGSLVWEARRFITDIATLDLPGSGQVLSPAGAYAPNLGSMETMEFYRQQIVLGIQDYARRCGFTRAVIGCSGGIDSAVVLALAAQALGPSNVLAITMPSSFSSQGSISDSVTLCNNLGVQLLEHPIAPLVDATQKSFAGARTLLTSTAPDVDSAELSGLALENLQARIRGTLLMGYSNTHGHLLLTTGNKSEISVGYSTLYGDSNGGLGPVGDLYKTEIFALARHLNASASAEIIPKVIIEKEPSAELAPGQRDQDSLPPYEVLDAVLKLVLEGDLLPVPEAQAARTVLSQVPDTENIQTRILTLISRSEYKRRQSAPLLRVRPRAFGSGRQVPIAARHF
jgi:NAD+ synthetase